MGFNPAMMQMPPMLPEPRWLAAASASWLRNVGASCRGHAAAWSAMELWSAPPASAAMPTARSAFYPLSPRRCSGVDRCSTSDSWCHSMAGPTRAFEQGGAVPRGVPKLTGGRSTTWGPAWGGAGGGRGAGRRSGGAAQGMAEEGRRGGRRGSGDGRRNPKINGAARGDAPRNPNRGRAARGDTP